jgi:hypothetical protein
VLNNCASRHSGHVYRIALKQLWKQMVFGDFLPLASRIRSSEEYRPSIHAMSRDFAIEIQRFTSEYPPLA